MKRKNSDSMLPKTDIILKLLGIFIAVASGFLAILTKTHLAFGGEYLSSKNLKITIGILIVIAVLLIGASIIDWFKQDEKDNWEE